MNRRTFLKAIGLAIAAPGAVIGVVKAAPPKAIPTPPLLLNPYLTAEYKASLLPTERAIEALGRWVRKQIDKDIIYALSGLECPK